MNEHTQPTEYPAANAPTYQTGSTKPPKSHVGVVSFLLGAVIFLCGISTILSLLRINLLQKRSTQAENRLCDASFVTPATVRSEPDTCPLGIQGLTLSDFWQDYRALPEGVLVTYAQAGHGVHAGDILLSVNGQQAGSWENLLAMLEQYDAGEDVSVTVYRQGAKKQLFLTIMR